jgi:hypothetical protein
MHDNFAACATKRTFLQSRVGAWVSLVARMQENTLKSWWFGHRSGADEKNPGTAWPCAKVFVINIIVKMKIIIMCGSAAWDHAAAVGTVWAQAA